MERDEDGESGGFLSDPIFYIYRSPVVLAFFLKEARNTSPEGGAPAAH